MHAIRWLPAALAFPLLAAPPGVQLLDRHVLTRVPSASAVLRHGSTYTIIGDDSPSLFQLDTRFRITGRRSIPGYTANKHGRIPKKDKPDLECATTFQWQGKTFDLVMGSGSRKGAREVAFLLSEDGKTMETFATSAFMARLEARLPAGETLNLEGLAATDRDLILLHRGRSGPSMLFRLGIPTVLDLLRNPSAPLDRLEAFTLHLPALQGHPAGLSGGDVHAPSQALCFTASVEVSDGSDQDGRILGSYVGILPLARLEDGMDLSPYMTLLTTAGGQPLVTKLESLVLEPGGDPASELQVMAVADLDDGTSECFRLKLKP